jgi:hypothetical protein
LYFFVFVNKLFREELFGGGDYEWRVLMVSVNGGVDGE